jgi:ribosomal protein S18 acetylase RimI-like enzyme
MTNVSIKTITESSQEQAIAVILLAFATDPAARWAFPDPQMYLTHFPEFISALADNAFERGTAYYVDGFSGAALWLPPGVAPREDKMAALIQRTIPEQKQKEMFAVTEQMGNYHPHEPHWYLPFIGVDAVYQGKGYGSALMQHSLIPCDLENKLAYLESSNPRNIPLYERYGFELLGKIQVGSSPPIFPMLRKPQSV